MHCKELRQLDAAIASYKRAIAINPNLDAARTGYAECISTMEFYDLDRSIHATTVRALSEAWIRPLDLSMAACSLLKVSLRKRNLLKAARGSHQTPSETGRIETDALVPLNDDALLHALLNATFVVDAELEDFLTLARRSCLENAASNHGVDNKSHPYLGFFCSLARQCFINEYVFSYAEAEIQTAAALKICW